MNQRQSRLCSRLIDASVEKKADVCVVKHTELQLQTLTKKDRGEKKRLKQHSVPLFDSYSCSARFRH